MPPPPLPWATSVRSPLLIQVTQVLSPSYKLTDLGRRLSLVVQRTRMGIRDARLPFGSRVGAQIDTSYSTVHTDGEHTRSQTKVPHTGMEACALVSMSPSAEC